MAKKEPLKVITKIVRADGIIPYDSLSEQEKAEFGKRMNRSLPVSTRARC